MGVRSAELGGMHIAKLFCMPVQKNISLGRLAEMSTLALLRNPKKLFLLQIVDLLVIDELGQVYAKVLSVMGMILRRARKRSQFMGGVLLISTMDNMQLAPVDGRPPLTSPYIITSFSFFKLYHSVRASQDPILQQIQDITPLPPSQMTSDVLKHLEICLNAIVHLYRTGMIR
jgi:hypothetical protein